MNHRQEKKCEPCESIGRALTPTEFAPYMEALDGWEVVEGKAVQREFIFKDFAEALRFVNRVGSLAEDEGHHPDILLYGWNKVRITLSTHALGGLSVNDFIVAQKIGQL